MSKPQNIATLRITGQIASPPHSTSSLLRRIHTWLTEWYNPLPRELQARGVPVLPPDLVEAHMEAELQKQFNRNHPGARWRYLKPWSIKSSDWPKEVGRIPQRIIARMRAVQSIPGVSVELWYLDPDPIVKVRRSRFLFFTIRATIGAYDTGNEELNNL